MVKMAKKKNKKVNEGEDEQEGEQEGNNEEEAPATPQDLQLSKEEAEQLLKALEAQEAKLQEKLDEPEGEAVPIIIEKDW